MSNCRMARKILHLRATLRGELAGVSLGVPEVWPEAAWPGFPASPVRQSRRKPKSDSPAFLAVRHIRTRNLAWNRWTAPSDRQRR